MNRFLRLTLMTCLIVMCFVVAGCGEKESADVSVKNYCEVILKMDLDAMKKLPQVDNPGQLHLNLLGSIINNYNQVFGGALTQQQITRIATAITNSFKKSDISTRVLSKDKNKATVEVTVGVVYLDKVDIIEVANKVDLEHPYASETDALEYLTQEIVNQIGALNPSGTGTLTVTCTYDKKNGVYVIDDVNTFSKQLMAKTIGY